jgi:hypothetical protein
MQIELAPDEFALIIHALDHEARYMETQKRDAAAYRTLAQKLEALQRKPAGTERAPEKRKAK